MGPVDTVSTIYFRNHVTASFSYSCSIKATTSNTVTLSFTNISNGDYLIMFDDGFVSDSNSNAATRKDGSSAKTLTLSFKQEARYDEIDPDYKGFTPDATIPAFVASWK